MVPRISPTPFGNSHPRDMALPLLYRDMYFPTSTIMADVTSVRVSVHGNNQATIDNRLELIQRYT